MNRTPHHAFPAGPLVALAAALTACSGGGGGGGNGDHLAPSLIGAAFAGATTTPAAGDTLLLSFSEDVTATVAATIDATALTLSGGGTLGSATTVQDQPTTRSVRLLLGSGVAFVPGTTTIDFTATNDKIADLAGNFGAAGAAVVITATDGIAPTLANLTLDAIDDALNGRGAAGGTLQVPQNAFTIDLSYSDAGTPTALGVDVTKTQIVANVPVASTSGTQTAGTNLLSLLTAVSTSSAAAKYLVPATMTFPASAVTLTATVLDHGGLQSTTKTFAFTVHAWTDALRPFETSPNTHQVWFLDTSRDLESFTTSPIAGGATVNIVAGANGRSDFLDILYVLGLQSTTPIANTSGSLDSNEYTLQRLQTAIVDNLDAFYNGANVTFTFAQPTGSFGSNSSVAYASLGYSQICIAGSDNSAGLILGIAQLDPSNTRQNNDCVIESATTSRLGVFLHTIADVNLGPPSNSTFRVAFNQICSAVGGTPIGNQTGDDSRLTGGTSDFRSIRIDNAIAGFARFIAVVTAHECGHSMGLVVNGAMPTGLYGGDSTNFPGSSDGHILNTALFPSGSTNIMSPQLDYDKANHASTAFNSLNLAYLREQAFYGN